jgi:hypothetical protein
MPVNDLIQFRRGNSAEWASSNPVLASGEPGYDLSSNILRIGDGLTNWSGLNNIGISNEAIDDRVGNLIVGGSGISSDYNDFNNTLTINFSGIDLGVFPLIQIQNQPSNTSGLIGDSIFFLIQATATFPNRDIYYQWQKSTDNIAFNNIANANASGLSISNMQISDSGYYRCYLTSELSYKYSDQVTLVLIEADNGTTLWNQENKIYSWYD